jgi:anti-sigma-K factor RskA
MDVGQDGDLIESGMQPMAGTDVVAFTLEPTGGSDQPTSAPIITGSLGTSS